MANLKSSDYLSFDLQHPLNVTHSRVQTGSNFTVRCITYTIIRSGDRIVLRKLNVQTGHVSEKQQDQSQGPRFPRHLPSRHLHFNDCGETSRQVFPFGEASQTLVVFEEFSTIGHPIAHRHTFHLYIRSFSPLLPLLRLLHLLPLDPIKRLQEIGGRGADAFTALPRRRRTDRPRPTTSVRLAREESSFTMSCCSSHSVCDAERT